MNRVWLIGFLLSATCLAVAEDNDGPCTAAPCTVAPAAPASASSSAFTPPKRLWAQSWIWRDAPELKVGKWLGEKPEMDGKFILVEFWRTWCGACKRYTPTLNKAQEKYRDDLVVIGICCEPEEALAKYRGPKKEYYLALDTPRDIPEPEEDPDTEEDEYGPDQDRWNARASEQGEYEHRFGVFGWPHVILLEPEFRAVVWEGFPGQKGHELTLEKIGRYIKAGKQ